LWEIKICRGFGGQKKDSGENQDCLAKSKREFKIKRKNLGGHGEIFLNPKEII
jgi:hypothetical protein